MARYELRKWVPRLATIALLISQHYVFHNGEVNLSPLPTKSPSYEPPSTRPPPSAASCPRDALKLGVCANLLKDLVHVVVGTTPKTPCCPLVGDVADLKLLFAFALPLKPLCGELTSMFHSP
ncbi:14 kDa proline-rich protein DC2.15-like [Hibiscus syriacus]|uniref:14 kDa proline-rich protein DC2.15-like n=1 Tax=Hibiscus syriacus TaxID=106335 RepID=UPI001923447F|nr:14 kDa proline-rich protein DC2.15-like [Hibiscus syriacus]